MKAAVLLKGHIIVNLDHRMFVYQHLLGKGAELGHLGDPRVGLPQAGRLGGGSVHVGPAAYIGSPAQAPVAVAAEDR